MNIVFIWDLDGTLLDSYPFILKSLSKVYNDFDIKFVQSEVASIIVLESVSFVLKKLSKELNIKYSEIKSKFSTYLRAYNSELGLLDNALLVLEESLNRGIRNFVITNKSDNALAILDNLNLTAYFEEIVTSSNKFAKKPSSDSLTYLLTKYNLDQDKCYYIGDRMLDIEFAHNSGVNSINFRSASNSYLISNLRDILNLDIYND